jgi:carbon monoxide dehydrogenase subunit G
MISTDHSFVVDAEIGDVWAYVSNIANWAASMPGYQSFEPIDELHSKWILKVALGALTKTVGLYVTITEQREPEYISFTLKGDTEPVDGQGTFGASPTELSQTSVLVTLSIAGSGAMAATMEAMSRPIVPRMTRIVSESLKEAIELSVTDEIRPPKPPRGPRWLRRLRFLLWRRHLERS